MILSELLGMIAENPDLLDDTRFRELVIAAWDDFEAWFYRLHTNDRFNKLYGWKSQVQETLCSSIWCVKHCPERWRNTGYWTLTKEIAAQLEMGMMDELRRIASRRPSPPSTEPRA
jgi:hypothetical protein